MVALPKVLAGLMALVLLGAPSAALACRSLEGKASLEPTAMMGQDPEGRDFEFYSASYALLIGQSNYAHWDKLDSVPSEIQRLCDALEADGFVVQVALDARSDALERTVDTFVRTYGYDQNARMLIYFAGHGAHRSFAAGLNHNQKISYALPVDAPKVDANDFLLKATRLGRFADWASALEVKHALFIFDSCFSGGIFEETGFRGDDPARTRQASNFVYSDSANRRVRGAITSGNADERVPQQSTFLDLMVEALTGDERTENPADANNDGYLTGTELATFLQGWVPIYSKTQTPDFGRLREPDLDRGEFLFRLPKRAAHAEAPPSPSAPDDLIPLYIGKFTDGFSGLVRAYRTSALRNTGDDRCANCSDVRANKKPYVVTLTMPVTAPSDAVFSDPEISCLRGDCEAALIASVPKISADGRTLTITIESWGAPTSWQLMAKVFAPRTTDMAGADSLVVDTDSRTVVPALIASLPIAEPGGSGATSDVKLEAVLSNLESGKTDVRRRAREELAMLLKASPALASDLVMRTPQASYRFQIGVATALNSAPGASLALSPAAQQVWSAQADFAKDETLKAAYRRVIVPTLPSSWIADRPSRTRLGEKVG